MREPHVATCQTPVTCNGFAAQRRPVVSARTSMVVSPEDGNDDVRITVPGVRFNLTDYVGHDDQGHHLWRLDDSRRWQTHGDGEPDYAVVARRAPGPGAEATRSLRSIWPSTHCPASTGESVYVSINRDFTFAELPHLIAFLISVHDELDEPPF